MSSPQDPQNLTPPHVAAESPQGMQRSVPQDQQSSQTISQPVPVIAAGTQNVNKFYGQEDTEVIALNNVSVQFVQNDFTSIMGPSGSGKSTLMHCLAGLDSVSTGKIFIGNTDITSLNDDELTKLRRDRIGFIFQGFNLIPTLTAEQNIKLPAELAKKTIDRDWFDTVVTTLGLQDRLNHRPQELSGGQQQRVAVARALLTRPDVIFADEPTGNLDSRVGAEVLNLMQHSTRHFGQTIIMVTHDPIAASYSDRVILLKDGNLVQEMHHPSVEQVALTMNNLGQ